MTSGFLTSPNFPEEWVMKHNSEEDEDPKLKIEEEKNPNSFKKLPISEKELETKHESEEDEDPKPKTEEPKNREAKGNNLESQTNVQLQHNLFNVITDTMTVVKDFSRTSANVNEKINEYHNEIKNNISFRDLENYKTSVMTLNGSITKLSENISILLSNMNIIDDKKDYLKLTRENLKNIIKITSFLFILGFGLTFFGGYYKCEFYGIICLSLGIPINIVAVIAIVFIFKHYDTIYTKLYGTSNSIDV